MALGRREIVHVAVHRGEQSGGRQAKDAAKGGNDLLDEIEATEPGPEHTLAAQSHLAAVMRNVDELPDNQRKALMLSVQEEMSVAEIASVLRQSIGSVEQLIVRARRQLREKNRRLL